MCRDMRPLGTSRRAKGAPAPRRIEGEGLRCLDARGPPHTTHFQAGQRHTCTTARSLLAVSPCVRGPRGQRKAATDAGPHTLPAQDRTAPRPSPWVSPSPTPHRTWVRPYTGSTQKTSESVCSGAPAGSSVSGLTISSAPLYWPSMVGRGYTYRYCQ